MTKQIWLPSHFLLKIFIFKFVLQSIISLCYVFWSISYDVKILGVNWKEREATKMKKKKKKQLARSAKELCEKNKKLKS